MNRIENSNFKLERIVGGIITLLAEYLGNFRYCHNVDGETVEFSVLEPSDLENIDRVADWMAQPYVEKFWERNWGSVRWREHIFQVSECGSTIPLMAVLDDIPVGYMELYRAADNNALRAAGATGHDLGIHMAIGDLKNTSRGLGTLLMISICTAIANVNGSALRLMAEPEAANHAVLRMLDKVGYDRLDLVEDRGKKLQVVSILLESMKSK